MSEPLSIGAGIAGLLSLSDKITTSISTFQDSVGRSAPESAHRLRHEICGLRVELSEVEGFLQTDSRQTEASNTRLIKVQDLLRVVTDCVLSLLALDILVQELVSGGYGILIRVRWAMKEKDVIAFTERLAQLKKALQTMTCLATHPAQFIELHAIIVNLRAGMIMSSEIDRRLESGYGYNTGSFYGVPEEKSIATTARARPRSQKSFVLPQNNLKHRSRNIYLRPRRSMSVDSLCTNEKAMDNYSIMSSFTLGDVSNVWYYALPLYLEEVGGLINCRPGNRCSPLPRSTVIKHCHNAIEDADIEHFRHRWRNLITGINDPWELEAQKSELAFAALKTRNTKFIQDLLSEIKFNVDSLPVVPGSSTLLYSAVELEDSSTVQTLLSSFSADPRVRIPHKTEATAVHLAIQRGDMVSLRLILNHDPGIIPFFNSNGLNLLLYAVQQGQCKIAQLLVSRGSSATETFSGGRTLLHYAAGRDRSRAVRGMIRWLVEECGIDVNTPSAEETPLTVALKEEFYGEDEGQELRRSRWNNAAVAELLMLGAMVDTDERRELRSWMKALEEGIFMEGLTARDLEALLEARPDIYD